MSARGDYLDQRAAEANAKSGVAVIGHLGEGDPSRVIAQMASDLDADVLFVGTHGRRGMARWVMGSIAEQLVRRAPCPVYVAREKTHGTSAGAEVEPPCPDCLALQRATQGAKLWCPRHEQRHPRPHLHYKAVDGFGAGSSLIRPQD
jgi:hypothetical protein